MDEQSINKGISIIFLDHYPSDPSFQVYKAHISPLPLLKPSTFNSLEINVQKIQTKIFEIFALSLQILITQNLLFSIWGLLKLACLHVLASGYL